MTFKERISRIERYNKPMAEAIVKIRNRYPDLYSMDVKKFESLVRRVVALGIERGDWQTRDTLLDNLYRKS
jgi:hypothetical protein